MSEATDHLAPLAVAVAAHPQQPANESGWSLGFTFAVIAACAVVAAALWVWSLNLRWRVETLSHEIQTLNQRWAIVSVDLDAAGNVQARYEAFLGQAKRVMAEEDAKRWTPALRSIAISAGTDIEIRGIRVIEESDPSPICSLHMEGVSTGPAPRAIADRFLQALRSELARQFQFVEPCRFERIEDLAEPEAAGSGQEQAAFTITATISMTGPPNVGGTKGF